MLIGIRVRIGNVCFPAFGLLHSVYKFLLVPAIHLQISSFIFSLQSQKIPFCICTMISDTKPRGKNNFLPPDPQKCKIRGLDDCDACPSKRNCFP